MLALLIESCLSPEVFDTPGQGLVEKQNNVVSCKRGDTVSVNNRSSVASLVLSIIVQKTTSRVLITNLYTLVKGDRVLSQPSSRGCRY